MNRYLLCTLMIVSVSLASCGKKEPAPDATTAAAATPYAGFDYTCTDGVKFNARIDRGDVVLNIDSKEYRLPADTNTSGAHYTGEGITFIAQGKEATLIRSGENARSCATP